MTGVTLADLADVRPQAINNYESGRSAPSPRVADAFAEALKMPLEFFFLPPRIGQGSREFYFRSMSATTKGARTRASRRAVWLCDLFDYLNDQVQFPALNLPRMDLPSKPSLISDDEIEEIADSVRDYWGMRRDPIANMVSLLENQGVVVSRGPLGDASLDGLSVTLSRPIVMIGTDKGTAVRWRFDAAHELGHLILHSHVAAEIAARPAEYKLMEQQAHRFAGAFLLPMGSFGEDFFAASLDAMQSIKPKWRVSIAAMIMRARHGGLITEDTARRLWVNYSRRGWRRQEPYDDRFEAEQPAVMGKAIRLSVENGNKHELIRTVGLPDSDIEALTSLPDGWLSQQDSAPVLWRGSPALADETGRDARVIHLRSSRTQAD
jgi:Zn-dependent peptidase ImmA (M78 family)/DNA-binding XRE family transcriptional regulator